MTAKVIKLIEDDEIKLCPMCGGMAKIRARTQATEIKCMDDNCGVSLTRFRWDDSHRAAAIMAWNRRALDREAATREAVIEEAAAAMQRYADGSAFMPPWKDLARVALAQQAKPQQDKI